MTSDSSIEALNRTLKEISRTLQDMVRTQQKAQKQPQLVRTLVQPLSMAQDSTEFEPTPRIFGWSVAAKLQHDGSLIKGDTKYESDESMWVWTGDGWERIERPSSGG